jgi:hypothetical protein
MALNSGDKKAIAARFELAELVARNNDVVETKIRPNPTVPYQSRGEGGGYRYTVPVIYPCILPVLGSVMWELRHQIFGGFFKQLHLTSNYYISQLYFLHTAALG